jgi:hypothetical protein
MNKRRLLKLADLLERDARDKNGISFDMGTWGIVSNKDDPISCDTRACAMGLAAVSGAFKRAGLSYRVQHNGKIIMKLGNMQRPLRVAARLFKISEYQAHELFARSWDLSYCGFGSAAEREVAQRIRKFVRENA